MSTNMKGLPELSRMHHVTCLKVGHFMLTWHHGAEARESLVQGKLKKYAKLICERRK